MEKATQDDIIKKYKTYQRGSIIYVDLKKGIDKEFSFKHFCLVINKKDNPRNGKLTIIPLTSKNKFSEPIDVSLLHHYLTSFNGKIKTHRQTLTSLQNKMNFRKRNYWSELLIIDEDLKKLERETNEYESHMCKIENLINKSSYAKLKDITTISKTRISDYMSGIDISIRLPKSETDRIVFKCFNNFN